MCLEFRAALGILAGVALLFFDASIDIAAAKQCDCKLARAMSDSSTGTCDVREYQGTPCQLIWGPEPSAKQASLSLRTPTEMVLTKLGERSIRARAEPSAWQGPTLPEIEQMTDPGFWKVVRGTVESKAPIDGDLYARSLAYLAQRNEVVERPQIAVGALLFVFASGVLASRAPEVQGLSDSILDELIRVRQGLVAFARENWKAGEIEWQVRQRRDNATFTILKGDTLVMFGCAEATLLPLFTQMVKAPWTPAESGRCK